MIIGILLNIFLEFHQKNDDAHRIFQEYLKSKYKWYSPEIYEEISNNCKMSSIIVFSIIEVESHGNPKAVGKPVPVYLYRNNKLVREIHRAIGIMQVMNFYAKESALFNVKENIRIGCRILNECLDVKKDIKSAISCYSTGKNSRWYNYRYVRKIFSGI